MPLEFHRLFDFLVEIFIFFTSQVSSLPSVLQYFYKLVSIHLATLHFLGLALLGIA